MRTALGIATLAALACTAGCRVHEHQHLAEPSVALVQRAQPFRAWRVANAAGQVGVVVEFRSSSGAGKSFYSVRNAWQQDLGMIDELGRAWAYQPHEREARWVGTGTVAEGAARILSSATPCHLIELADGDWTAAAGPAPRGGGGGPIEGASQAR